MLKDTPVGGGGGAQRETTTAPINGQFTKCDLFSEHTTTAVRPLSLLLLLLFTFRDILLSLRPLLPLLLLLLENIGGTESQSGCGKKSKSCPIVETSLNS